MAAIWRTTAGITSRVVSSTMAPPLTGVTPSTPASAAIP